MITLSRPDLSGVGRAVAKVVAVIVGVALVVLFFAAVFVSDSKARAACVEAGGEYKTRYQMQMVPVYDSKGNVSFSQQMVPITECIRP
jgi:hypothetical protein